MSEIDIPSSEETSSAVAADLASSGDGAGRCDATTVNVSTNKMLASAEEPSSDTVTMQLAIDDRKTKGITIVLDAVGAEISIGSRSLFDMCRCRRKLDSSKVKALLSEITGMIHSGDMCAVMGPSGAGKTTLLDIISRRKTEGILQGKVLFDGAEPSMTMIKKFTAYIQQQDMFFGGATVEETIIFAAMAKLPGNSVVDIESKLTRVSDVIYQMNLQRCKNTLIGNRLIRGVSGGELKRVAVACALLCSPRCMFLDEPTSGLDSTMAQEVVCTLRTLQMKTGCTFIVTIHQPAPTVYNAFNKLILLNEGRLAYFGEGGHQPLAFFANVGFPYQQGYNVAEYLIDTLQQQRKGECDFAANYQSSALCQANISAIKHMSSSQLHHRHPGSILTTGINNNASPGSKYANNTFRELWILIRYKGLTRFRHPLFIFTRVGLYVLLSCLLSSFFYGQNHDLPGIVNIVGILFISIILPSFMAQVFVEEMKIDREVYTREFHDAYYRAGTYVAHRIIVEMPTVILATTTFSTILYWSVGLNAVADNFLFFMLVTGTNFITAMLVGFTISSMLPGEVGPAVLLPVFTTLNMLVGGFFIRESTIHSMWIWLYWISFSMELVCAHGK